MADAIQTSIYKLRPSIAVIDSKNKLVSNDIDLDYLEDEFKKHGYQPQKLMPIRKPGHDFRLFYNTWNAPVKWKEFIAEIVQAGEDILNANISVNEGFILLVSIRKRNKKELYAITGGFGHIELQSYIDYQFGLNILSRLIQSQDKVLKAAKERNFVGGVLGSVKYFRGDYNLNENESFGNYYQELRAKLEKTILKSIFKFTDDELKRGGLCDAKSSFTIRKPLTFDRAIEVVDILDNLIRKRAIVDLNLIKKLDKSDKALIGKLDKELDKELFSIYKGNISDVNVEICHRIFDRYYDASEFELSFPVGKKSRTERIPACGCLHDILDGYTNADIRLKTHDDVKKLLDNSRITSFGDDGKQLTTGRLVDHICAELRFNNRSYFLFNQEWYLVKKEFASILNKQCKEFINAHLLPSSLLKKWHSLTESENDFNAKHLGDKDTLVFDKVTPENIEACDILKWNAKEVYFIHVKKGFNNEMRNLGRQVHISARRVVQDLKSGKGFLGKLYDELLNKSATTTYFKNAQFELKKHTKHQFLKIFENRKPVFVLAILDSSKKGKRSLADITNYNSNIAKFCLHQLSQEMRLLDTDLKVLEVQM
jgi:uncharacterized protein (TIGR04141 family)